MTRRQLEYEARQIRAAMEEQLGTCQDMETRAQVPGGPPAARILALRVSVIPSSVWEGEHRLVMAYLPHLHKALGPTPNTIKENHSSLSYIGTISG